MTNLIPMAGEGARFLKEGYKDPKPLIDISGKPMILQAAAALPRSDRWVFVCRKEHINKYRIDRTLKEAFPNSAIIEVDHLTKGQACTCLLAEPYLKADEPLLIGACDNGAIWDKEKYFDIIEKERVDALIWTFRNNVTVQRKPKMYGWVEVDAGNNALRISCKIPISDEPVRDHAIIGTFYFRRAGFFIDAAKQMIAANRSVNNEFYVDTMMNELIEAKLKVKVFEVDKYICWGTPDDVRTYNYWENYFNKILARSSETAR